MEHPPDPVPALRGRSHTVSVGNVFGWWRRGWSLFIAEPIQWLLLSLILAVIMLASARVPLIGGLAAMLLTPVFMAGMLYAGRRGAGGEKPEVADLFIGFRQRTDTLLLLGVLYALAQFLIFLVVLAVFSSGIFGADGNTGPNLGAVFVVLALLLSLILSTPLLMAMWFAPALVFFDNMQPLAAMKVSFAACMENLLPILTHGLIILLLSFFASLPVLLGFLVFLPVLFGSVLASYRDVFARE